MAITFLEKRKKQRYLLLVLAAVIIIGLFAFWYLFLTKMDQLFPKPPEEALPSKKKLEVSWDVLKDPRVESLETFQDIPSLQQEEGEAGRENPFVPFSTSTKP